MNVILYNTKHDLHINILNIDLKLQKVNELTLDKVNHNIVSLRRVINYRCENDVLTNFYCDFSTRLNGCASICSMLYTIRYTCGLNDKVYNELIIYTFKKAGVYEFIADDIFKNIFKGDD